MRKTLQTYEKYRDSGFQWLGKIPDHWEVKKFNYIADIVEGQVDPKEHPYQNYILVAPNHIESGTGRLICQETALDQGAISGKYLFQSGDIIYSKIRPALRKVWKAEFPGICSADMYPIRLSKKIIDPRYFTFLCLSESFSGFMIATSMRVAMPKVNRDDFHECHFIIPSITEQKVIAHYLDTKTAQIDRKIDLLTQKAQRYEELKRSLINETVTRGLDKSVPMKDSAIEWIGEIPEHWEIFPIRTVIENRIEKNTENTEDEYLSLVAGIGVIPYAEKGNVGNKKPENLEKCKMVYPGDFVLNSMNFGIGSFGISRFKGVCSSVYIVMKPKCIKSGEFLYRIFQIKPFQIYISSFGKGIMEIRMAIKWSDLKNIHIPVPPLSEQQAIARYLDTKTAQIDQIIQTINTQIEKLKELRKTLINDVVTGKIKVA